ncbi:spore germination protein [Aneurinibacillus uraniidurans]|uniref:spore germination protein n=1 Tax=Aneurinibacillus uraniidurans TaxID=2966586 RepID=UPI00234BC268|nr:spore germination protein [Aneurinibacillus sp. B1]WCN37474.1 spore germination protein [Aneurinibacillus sp. B1]
MDEQEIRGLFAKCYDVQLRDVFFLDNPVLLVYCPAMINGEILNTLIFERLDVFFRQNQELTADIVQKELHVPDLQSINNKDQATADVFSGKLLLVFKREKWVFSTDISHVPQRNPEETKTEVSIKGPRDDFIEDIAINVALIRKRLRTDTLCYEQVEIGRRTRTKVGILYMDDIASKEILQQIQDKLHAIDIDGIYSGNQLHELITENPYPFFPKYQYTGRPDFAVQSLLSGRFLLLVDGVSYVMIIPTNLFLLLKTGEDTEYTFAYNSFERIMRIAGLAAATFLPGFWVALTAFHQNQLPFTLLATVVEARRGVPLPSGLEAVLMLILFELFREAGMRLPLAIGQTLSVVGGLIIGDAAIRAGLTSPAMLVIIGASTVATFTLANQSLVGTITLLRFFVLSFAAALGFFGYFLSVYFIFLYVANIRTFGVPYLELATRLNTMNILKAIFRLPAQKFFSRPRTLDPRDPTRMRRRKS